LKYLKLKKVKEDNMDNELDDLLDDALEDFDKNLVITPKIENDDNNKTKVTVERTNLYVDDVDDDDRPPPPPSQFKKDSKMKPSDDFNMKLFEEIFKSEEKKGTTASNEDPMKQFQQVFELLNTDDESKLMENFQKVMSEFGNNNNGGDEDDDDDDLKEFEFLKNFSQAAKETLVNKPDKQSKENENPSTSASTSTSTSTSASTANPLNKVLDNMNKSSEEFFKKSSEASANGGGSKFPFDSDFFSFLNNLPAGGDDDDNEGENNEGIADNLMMQPVLSMLFSKEILYPSLKLMRENYDTYINEKRGKMTQDELQKCFDQKECIEEMCVIYEEQTVNDSKEKKAERLKNILDLLEKCGVSILFIIFKFLCLICLIAMVLDAAK
jgi:hypothetical protein